MRWWQVVLLVAGPLAFVLVMGVFAWAATTDRDLRWGARSSAWLKRHPVLWGVLHGAVWAIPGPIWMVRGRTGMALFYAGAFIAFGVLGWWTITRAAAVDDRERGSPST